MMRGLYSGLVAATLLATPALAQPQQFGSGGNASPPAATPAPPAAPAVPAVPAPGAAPAAPAAPQAGTPGKPTSPEALAVAKELLELTGAARLANQTMTQVSEQVSVAIAQQNNKPVAEVRRIVEEVLMPEFRARVPEIVEFSANLWASQMTADELRQLVAFYRTPLGQRLTEVTPVVASQSAIFGMRWGQEVAISALQKHAETLRQRGLRI
jgi:uncharacterized protein